MPVEGKTKQEVLSEFRCLEILEAARKVFAKKGFSRATMEDIAEAAGVAKGTVYLYFPSKQAIYVAALEQGIEALYDLTEKKLRASVTAEDKLRAFVETRIQYFDEHRDFFKIYYSELGNIFSPPNAAGKDFKALYTKQARQLERALEEGIERGEIHPLPAGPTAFAIYDLTRGLVARRLLGWSKAAAADDVAYVMDLAWKGIRRR